MNARVISNKSSGKINASIARILFNRRGVLNIIERYAIHFISEIINYKSASPAISFDSPGTRDVKS